MKILIAVNQSRVLYDFKRELVAALAERGAELFFSFEEDFRAPFFDSFGTSVSTPIDPRGVSPAKDARLYFFYRKLLTRIRPDVALTLTIKPNVYCGLACRRLDVPYLATISGLGTAANGGVALRKIAMILYRVGLKGASGIFCQNAAIEKRLVDEKIATSERIVSVPGSGVDLERFAFTPYPPDDGTTRFLFIGRLMRDKGVVEFLECARRIRERNSNVVFQMIGAPERGCAADRATLAAARAGLVEYRGYQEDVRPEIRAANAIVLPSYHEGLSNVLLESAASGRPVLASNAPGCVETFDDGVTGFGFAPRDADALTAAVEKFLTLSFDQKCEMGRRAREKVERTFSRAEVVAQYLNEIERVVGPF